MYGSLRRKFGLGLVALGAFSIGEIYWKYRQQLSAHEKPAETMLPLPATGDFVDYHSAKSVPSNIVNIAKHGFPSNDALRSYPNFVVSYDRKNKIPHWVLEHITPSMLKSDNYDRGKENFFEDTSFHPFFRATNVDYKGSGYDRGHLAAAGNYRANPEYVRETFVLSNIAPQVGKGFNRDKWNDLERYTRKKILKSTQGWVCSGPLFLPRRDLIDNKFYIRYEVIGNNQVAVPTHFFKAILTEMNGRYFLETFVLPNAKIADDVPLSKFRVHPETVERSAGILLFNTIHRNQLTIESENLKLEK